MSETKNQKWQDKSIVYRYRKSSAFENKTGNLYNDTVQQKRDVAQLGSAFVLGKKCHGFQSCHPYLFFSSGQ